MEHHTHDTGGGFPLVNLLNTIALNAMTWIFTLNNLQSIATLFFTFLSILSVSYNLFNSYKKTMEQREAKRIAKELEGKPKAE